jgi:serine/threonine protein kinase
MKSHLGHYEIVSELGRGGMGVVYKGYEPALARYVAIKELSSALSHDPAVVERFLREARSMALLNDPHIIQIYSIGQENELPFFVMEFVDGSSVAALIQRDMHLQPGDALKIVHQTAKGLSAAHDRGVIHRDVKPANLILSQRGQVKIADFGIALANADMNQKLTSAGEMVGTPGYLPPELLLGKAVDQRSDVYALGVVLFEMLTGRTPFSDASVYKLMLDVVQTEVPDVREINSDIDPGVAAILAKMLIKDPAKRYQSMAELITDLDKHPLVANGTPLKLGIRTNTGGDTLQHMQHPLPQSSVRAQTPPPVMDRRGPISSTLVKPRRPEGTALSGRRADAAATQFGSGGPSGGTGSGRARRRPARAAAAVVRRHDRVPAGRGRRGPGLVAARTLARLAGRAGHRQGTRVRLVERRADLGRRRAQAAAAATGYSYFPGARLQPAGDIPDAAAGQEPVRLHCPGAQPPRLCAGAGQPCVLILASASLCDTHHLTARGRRGGGRGGTACTF